MKILLDVDGCVADYTQAWLAALKEATGRVYVPADVTTWEYRECIPLQRWEEIATEYELARRIADLPEMPGAFDAVTELRRKHEVIFVTSPHPRMKEWAFHRAEWLEKRFPKAPIVSTRHKELVGGDLLIDDRPENLIAWRAAHRGQLFLWDQPYNRKAVVGSRIKTWAEAAEAIHAVHALTHLDTIAQRRAP